MSQQALAFKSQNVLFGSQVWKYFISLELSWWCWERVRHEILVVTDLCNLISPQSLTVCQAQCLQISVCQAFTNLKALCLVRVCRSATAASFEGIEPAERVTNNACHGIAIAKRHCHFVSDIAGVWPGAHPYWPITVQYYTSRDCINQSEHSIAPILPRTVTGDIWRHCACPHSHKHI